MIIDLHLPMWTLFVGDDVKAKTSESSKRENFLQMQLISKDREMQVYIVSKKKNNVRNMQREWWFKHIHHLNTLSCCRYVFNTILFIIPCISVAVNAGPHKFVGLISLSYKEIALGKNIISPRFIQLVNRHISIGALVASTKCWYVATKLG